MTPTQLEKIKGEFEEKFSILELLELKPSEGVYNAYLRDKPAYHSKDIERNNKSVWQWFESKLEEVEKETVEKVINKFDRDDFCNWGSFIKGFIWGGECDKPEATFAKFKEWIREEYLKSNKLERENTEGCDDCKGYPNKWVQVTDIKNPHCLKCGRKLNIK